MSSSQKKTLITAIIGTVLLLVGIILIIVGLNIKRPVVIYKNSDGSIIAEVKVAIGKNSDYAVRPVSPDKDKDRGYTRLFKGWQIDGTDEIVDVISVTEDKNIEVTAVYEKAIMYYSIKYNLAGGTLLEGDSIISKYTILMSYEFPTPVRSGYTFLGWYKTGTNVLVNEIEVGSIGDLNIVAKWEKQ